jgi:hypothetical protein
MRVSSLGWILGGGALLIACGGAAPSVSRFGEATHGFADGMAQTARGSADVCEQKQRLDLDQQLALGELGADGLLAKLRENKCAGFRKTGALYAQLARQLGAFGLAMKTLADAGNRDYTADVAPLTASAAEIAGTSITQEQLTTAGGLVTKLLSWFSQGYSRSKLSSALVDSNREVEETIKLLGVVLDAYEVQLKGYSLSIDKVSQDPEFSTPRAGEPEGALERRKAAQRELVQEHETTAAARRELLTASKSALKEVAKVHGELVEEAKRDRKEFDVPKLMESARALSGQVAEFRDLVSQLAER